ncbi:MAG: NmrA family transcriptional regulator [Pseudonocardiales bacterium]|nr:MAG: NmrA family transcriptional regulator [Pseudonocardiales bacterium]
MTEQTHAKDLTLVLCGTGKTGRRVAQRLRAHGHAIRIGSRYGEPPFDWEDQATWAPALSGVSSAYVAYVPDAGFAGAADKIGTFAKLAVDYGARRLVLLTGRGEEGAERSEQAARDTGAALTIVRASFFAQNFSEDFLAESVRAGVVVFPAGDVAEPFVDADDIADVAVAALTDERHAGQCYEVTGPRLLTFADAAAEIASASGRTVRYLPVSPQQFGSVMIEQGAPAMFVAQLIELLSNVLDGHNAHLSDGVQRALGRMPRDFTDYASAAAANGAWAAERSPGLGILGSDRTGSDG